MPKVTYVSHTGEVHVVEAVIGESVMLSAVKNGVSGIIGECGGNSSCATCHVWVREEYQELVGPAEDLEDDLLDLAVSERREGSRLSCQVEVTERLDGIIVDLPPEQP